MSEIKREKKMKRAYYLPHIYFHFNSICFTWWMLCVCVRGYAVDVVHFTFGLHEDVYCQLLLLLFLRARSLLTVHSVVWRYAYALPSKADHFSGFCDGSRLKTTQNKLQSLTKRCFMLCRCFCCCYFSLFRIFLYAMQSRRYSFRISLKSI